MVRVDVLEALAREPVEDTPAHLAEWMRAAFGWDTGGSFSVSAREGGWEVMSPAFTGDLELPRAWLKLMKERPMSAVYGYTPDLPDPAAVNRLRDLDAAVAENKRTASQLRSIYQTERIFSQERVLLYDGRRMLGWLGAIHRDPLRAGPRVRAEVHRALAGVRAALRAHALANDEILGEGTNALVFTPGGGLEHGAPGAVRWLTRRRRELVLDLLRSFRHEPKFVGAIDGVEVGLTRLDAVGAERILVTLSASMPPLLHPFHDLSPRQRQVAEAAANGLSAPEIAELLTISEATVRVHLRAIYQVLGVSSRAELGRRFEEAFVKGS